MMSAIKEEQYDRLSEKSKGLLSLPYSDVNWPRAVSEIADDELQRLIDFCGQFPTGNKMRTLALKKERRLRDERNTAI